MLSFRKTRARNARYLRIGFLAVVFAGAFLAVPAMARPANLDQSLDRYSDHGLFHLQLQSAVRPIPLWRVHQWTVRLTDTAGQPVTSAAVTVDGGMPAHHHGLPTAPRATPGAAAGDYVINGVKFSMPGWWVLKLDVRDADGHSDTITFNLVL
jgi:hypothetical protein